MHVGADLLQEPGSAQNAPFWEGRGFDVALASALPCPGEIPGLFSSEELAKELMPLEQRKNDDVSYSGPSSLYAYFVYRCGTCSATPPNIRN